MDAPIQLEPYNPAWPAAFIAERDLLASVLSPWLIGPIEHVGSTAVPGLAAKPVIDIMAPVKDLESSRPALAVLGKAGYCYAPYKADEIHWFCKPSPEHRTHHLHLVPLHSPRWIESLASVHRHDRNAYTEAKGSFIEAALRGVIHEEGSR